MRQSPRLMGGSDVTGRAYVRVRDSARTQRAARIRSGRIEALWEPPDTLPADSEVERKFLCLTGPILGFERSEKLAREIWAADQWTTIDPIIYGCLAEEG